MSEDAHSKCYHIQGSLSELESSLCCCATLGFCQMYSGVHATEIHQEVNAES